MDAERETVKVKAEPVSQNCHFRIFSLHGEFFRCLSIFPPRKGVTRHTGFSVPTSSMR
jgi:hypothetical protein